MIGQGTESYKIVEFLKERCLEELVAEDQQKISGTLNQIPDISELRDTTRTCMIQRSFWYLCTANRSGYNGHGVARTVQKLRKTRVGAQFFINEIERLLDNSDAMIELLTYVN